MQAITFVIFSCLTAFVSSMAPDVFEGDNFCYEKRENDLYFAMARVTDKVQAAIWLAIYEYMEDMETGFDPATFKHTTNEQSIYMARRAEIEKLIPQSREIRRNVRGGAVGAGLTTLKLAAYTFEEERPVHLWIAYAWSSTTAPTYPIKPSDIMNIEMIMTVTSAAPFLYTWHMGVTRNKFWRYFAEPAMHKHTSVLFHAYAARVMKDRYSSLHYVRSNLLKSMADLLKDKLAAEIERRVFFNQDNLFIKDNEEGQVTLLGLPRGEQAQEIIWQGSSDKFDWPRDNGGIGFMFLADINYLAELSRLPKGAASSDKPNMPPSAASPISSAQAPANVANPPPAASKPASLPSGGSSSSTSSSFGGPAKSTSSSPGGPAPLPVESPKPSSLSSGGSTKSPSPPSRVPSRSPSPSPRGSSSSPSPSRVRSSSYSPSKSGGSSYSSSSSSGGSSKSSGGSSKSKSGKSVKATSPSSAGSPNSPKKPTNSSSCNNTSNPLLAISILVPIILGLIPSSDIIAMAIGFVRRP
jgi:uncharacterized membrane protein YgcG